MATKKPFSSLDDLDSYTKKAPPTLQVPSSATSALSDLDSFSSIGSKSEPVQLDAHPYFIPMIPGLDVRIAGPIKAMTKKAREELGMFHHPEQQGFSEFLMRSVPFAKFALPNYREEWKQLDEWERFKVMTWESIGAGLYAFGGPIMGAAGRGIKRGAKATVKKVFPKKLIPVEDALETIVEKGGLWRGFSLRKNAREELHRYGFTKFESDTVSKVLLGQDERLLKDLALEIKFQGKKFSPGWARNVKPIKAKAYGGFKLREGLKSELSPEHLMHKHYKMLYRANLKRQGHASNWAKGLIRKQAEKSLGKDIAKTITLGNLDEETTVHLVAEMLLPKGQKLFAQLERLGADRHFIPLFTADRFVWGAGERLFGAKSGVFDKVVAGKEASNTYVFQKVKLFTEMLQQRGFGKIKIGRTGDFKFIPNKTLYNGTGTAS